MEEADVEPDRRVERAVLMQTEPGEFFVVGFAVGLAGEVTVLNTPVSDGASNSMNNLLNAGFTFGSAGFAVKVLADDDVCRQRAPARWNLAVLLFKEDSAVFVLDVSSSRFSLDCVERVDAFRTEMSLDFHRAGLGNDCATVPILGFEIILEESLAAVHRALSLFKPHEINELILSSFSPVVGLSRSASCRCQSEFHFNRSLFRSLF